MEPWWDNLANLMKYDIVLHSCDGIENPTNKSAAAMQALKDYADTGGRVFASHWHNYWFENGPAPWPDIATFNHQSDLPTRLPGRDRHQLREGSGDGRWLDKVGGSSMFGVLTSSAASTPSAAPAPRAGWIYSDSPASVQYLEALTPIGGPACGRVVLSDLHVASGEGSTNSDRPAPASRSPRAA